MSKLNFYIWWMTSTWCGLLDQCKYSKEWDDELNTLLTEFGSNAVYDGYTLTLNHVEIWTSNELYCYGHNSKVKRLGGHVKYERPSISTMYRLWLCCEWHRNGKPIKEQS